VTNFLKKLRQKYPRAIRWLRLDHLWSATLGWWEEAGARALRKLQQIEARFERRIPHCKKRPRVQLALEGLESRYVFTTVQFSAATYSVLESAASVTVTVTLSALPGSNQTINYATSDGTAKAGTDYTNTSGTLTFTPSDLSKTFTVPILDDGITDANETFTITLSSPSSGLTLGSPTTATTTITDTHYTIATASSQPQGLIAGGGYLWFVENAGNKLVKMTTAGVMTEYSLPASSAPDDVAYGPDGKLYVTASGTNKILQVSTSGSVLNSYSRTGSGTPDRIVVGPDNLLWYTVDGASLIGKMTTSGTFTEYTFSAGGVNPTDIIAAPGGGLAVAAGGLYNVDTSGNVSQNSYVSDSSLVRLAAAADGTLWYTAYNGYTVNAVGRLTPDERNLEYTLPTSSASPKGLAIASDGTVWVAENAGNQLASLSSSGVFTEYTGITASDPTDLIIGPDTQLWFLENSANKAGKFFGVPGEGFVRSDDPVQADWLAVNGNAVASGNTGNLLLQHPLDLNRSPGNPVLGGPPALVYNSGTVNVKPIVEVSFTSDPNQGVPTSIQGQLTWNGSAQSAVTFSTSGHSAGDVYALDLQGPVVSSTGYYPWTVTLTITPASGAVYTRTVSGNAAVVANASSDYFGEGWSLAGLDRIVSVTGGALLVSGSTGSAEFFATSGSPVYGTQYFFGPDYDFGLLTQNTSDNSYQYQTFDKTAWNFSSSGFLTSIVEVHSLTRTFLYDGSNKITGILDPDGSSATFAYDGNNNLNKIQAPGNRTVTLLVDGSSNLTSIQDADGSLQTLAYDATTHQLTSDARPSPLAPTSYAWDSYQRLGTVTLDATVSMTLAPAADVAMATSPAKNLSAVQGTLTDALNRAYKRVYDQYGRSTQLVTPDGGSGTLTQTWSRDFSGQATSWVDTLNRTTTYVNSYFIYNSPAGTAGGLSGVTSTHPDGTSDGFTNYPYFGHIGTVKDALNNTTSWIYDLSNGDLKTITDAMGGVTTYLHDSTGLVTGIQDPKTNLTAFSYTAARQLQSVTDALNNATTYQNDSAGNATVTIDPLLNRTTTLYDAMRRVTSVAAPGLNTATMLYNGIGQVTDQTDAEQVRTTSAYDDLGRMSAQTVGVGSGAPMTMLWTFDKVGNRTSSTDAAGNIETLLYDSLNRVTTTVDTTANGLATVLTYYDAASNVTGTKDADGRLTKYFYDALNRVTGTQVTVDSVDQLTQTLRDAAGRVTGVKDALGNLTQYLVDPLGRATVTIDGLGNRVTQLYDKAGNLTGTLDGAAQLWQQLYDADNRLTETIDPLSNQTSKYFDARGLVTESVDANNNATQFLNDALGRQTVVIDGLNKRTTTLYDLKGNITGVLDANANLTQFLIDALGRQTVTIDGAGDRTTQILDAAGRATVTIDGNGNRTTQILDTVGRATVTINALNYRTTTLFDQAGNVTQVQTQVDAITTETTKYQFDAANRLTVTIDALNGRTTTYFDKAGNATVQVDAVGNRTTTLFDANNRPTVTIDATGARTTTLFDGDGRATVVIDANGNRTTQLLDIDGRSTVTIDAGNNRTTRLYDAQGNLTQVMDANNNITQFLIDALNRQTVTIDATSKRSTSLFDPVGNLTGSKDANGNLTQFLFDGANRQTVTIDPSGARTTQILDGLGQATVTIDANNHRATVLLDALGRATVTIDANSFRTTKLYDGVGNMTSLQDASGNTTTFALDALNRVTSQTDQLGNTATMAYDAVSRLTSSTDRDGRVRAYFYDGVSRVTGQTWYSDHGVTVSARLTFLYDKVGNITVAADTSGAYTLSYDALNRVTAAQDMWGVTATMGYDGVGNRTKFQDKFGTETSTFDGDNRLQTREFAGISTTKVRIDLAYQDNGLLSTEKRYSDLTATTQVGASTYLYDAANRVTGINHFNGSGTALGTYAYLNDAVGNVTQEVDNGSRTLNFSVDNANQVTADTLHTYTYDGTGNRNNTGWSTPTGNENELQSDPNGWSYSYDAEGNITKKTKGISAETWLYRYDDANHMTVAQQYDKDPTNGGVLENEWFYYYDAFGNRIEQYQHVGGTMDQRYALDGWDPPTQGATGNAKWEVFADLDGTNSNALETRYLRGDQVDQFFARIASDGTAAWLLTDHLGSVVGVTNNSGVLKDTILYDAWGNKTSESDSTWTGRYQWTGKAKDSGTGLQYNDDRYYDAATGKWSTQDPTAFNAGDCNLYRYANNAPTTATDPSGLEVFVRHSNEKGYIKTLRERFGRVGIKIKDFWSGYDRNFIDIRFNSKGLLEKYRDMKDADLQKAYPELSPDFVRTFIKCGLSDTDHLIVDDTYFTPKVAQIDRDGNTLSEHELFFADGYRLRKPRADCSHTYTFDMENYFEGILAAKPSDAKDDELALKSFNKLMKASNRDIRGWTDCCITWVTDVLEAWSPSKLRNAELNALDKAANKRFQVDIAKWTVTGAWVYSCEHAALKITFKDTNGYFYMDNALVGSLGNYASHIFGEQDIPRKGFVYYTDIKK
jgi:RHS repeat-associated protein